jgi:Cyclic nucleotide-binding domain/Major Facilitator Superfamily
MMHIGRAQVAGVGQRLAESARAVGAVSRAPALRRVLLAFGFAWTSEWAFMVALGVVAFRSGGATAVGVVAFVRMAPAALLAPVSIAVADRFRRDHVLMYSSLVRGGAIGAATLLLAIGAPLITVYALAVLATAAFIIFRPAHSALLPALCSVPLELTSANVVRGLLDSLGTLLGPLIAAALLAFSGTTAAFAFAAALSFGAGALLMHLSYEAPQHSSSLELRRIITDTSAGFGALWRHRDAGLLIGLALAQTFTRGCLNVFLVVVPFELLHTGQTGVGLMTAALGAGAVAGSIGALLLVSGRRLALIEGIGIALWGLGLSLCGALPYLPTVLALMAVIGVGNAFVDVGLFTLPARLVPYELLARVFGALESLVAVTVAIGSLVTPFVIAVLGVRGALAVLGLPAVALVALAWRRLRTIDHSIVHRDGEITLLKRVAILRPLPMPTIDTLAANVEYTRVAAGEDVFLQGDAGDRFYVIGDGEADVVGDGRLVSTLSAGDCFGEIALLRNTPRTATVRARTTLGLYSLARPEFLLAVNGFSASAIEANTLLHGRLASFTPRPPGV